VSALPSGGEESPRISVEEFTALIRATIPMTATLPFEVESVGWGRATVRLRYSDQQLRAGGTINGPAIMTLVDTALYAAVLTRIGLEPLAVTSDLSFHFLRKPEPRDLVATATLLRVGRRLAVGTVEVASAPLEGVPGPVVAHATGSYALPAR
jgi:uncharacterized protein (TIGR00369 family)